MAADRDSVFITEHAVEQWERRGGWTGDSPVYATVRNAWHRGEPVPHEFDADEVRYDARDDMVLLERNGVIVTVVPATGPAVRADIPQGGEAA